MQLLKYRPNKESEWKEIATIAIGNIPSGGSLPAEALTISGNCDYKFYRNNWNWFVKSFGSKITTNDITNGYYMFQSSDEIEENAEKPGHIYFLYYLYNLLQQLNNPYYKYIIVCLK